MRFVFFILLVFFLGQQAICAFTAEGDIENQITDPLYYVHEETFSLPPSTFTLNKTNDTQQNQQDKLDTLSSFIFLRTQIVSLYSSCTIHTHPDRLYLYTTLIAIPPALTMLYIHSPNFNALKQNPSITVQFLIHTLFGIFGTHTLLKSIGDLKNAEDINYAIMYSFVLYLTYYLPYIPTSLRNKIFFNKFYKNKEI